MLRFAIAIILTFSLAFCSAQIDERSVDDDAQQFAKLDFDMQQHAKLADDILVDDGEQRYAKLDVDLQQRAKLDYDILTLAQSWPQTSCWDLNKKWTSSGVTCSPCKMPKAKERWTAHGLWPSSRKGKHPFNCDDNYQFNEKLLSAALRKQLEEKWPSFKLNMKLVAFWGHEWKKHGTCALDLDSTNSLPKYFSRTVQLLDAYNVGAILANSGIVPGNKYKSDDVVKAVEKTLGVTTYVKCSLNTVSREYFLTEIHVCFDKSFRLTDCSAQSTVTCSGKQVIYPRCLSSC